MFGSFNKPAGQTGFGTATSGTAAPASSPFGGFGQQQQQQPSGQQAAGGGLFGSTNTNTAAQNTSGSSLFGNQAANTSGSSLFGKPAANTGGSSLFGQSNAQNTSGSSLFGQNTQNTQAQPAGGGLFGQPQQQQGSTTGGLFGQQQQNTGAGSTGTGLFPQNNASNTTTGGLFGQQAKPAGSLFGGASTNTAGQTGGSLFGGQQQQQQQQPAASGGLFGQQSTTQSTQPSTSLFGQKQQSTLGQPQAQNSLLGQSNSNTQGGLGKNTRLADCPEEVRKVFEQMDTWIKDQKQVGAKIDTTNIGRAIWQTSVDVKSASDEQAALAQGLYSLRASLEQLAARVKEQANDLSKLLETWEAAKPADARSNNIRPVAHPDFPQEYFFRVARSLEERVTRYKRTIALLTRAITSLAHDSDVLSPHIVAQTIQNNQSAIVTLAGQLDELQLRMNSLRNEFIREYRERTHSMRNPFEVAREEREVSLLRA